MRTNSIGILIGRQTKGTFRNLTIDLSKGLAYNGIKRIYVLYFGEEINTDLYPEEVRFVKLKCRRTRYMVMPLIKEIRRLDLDIIISMTGGNNIFCIIAKILSAKKNTRLIISEHASIAYKCYVEYKNNWKYRILPTLMRIFYPFADAIYTVNEIIKKELREIIKLKQTEQKIKVIYNPIDIDRVREKSKCKPARWTPKEKEFIICSTGRLTKQKNFPLLLSAIAQGKNNENLRLIIIGTGTEEAKLRKLSSKLEIENMVDFVGFVENPWSYMARSDLFVLSSTEESFGLVLVEAMACGVPVVSTDARSGGPKTIIGNNEYGILVDNGNTKSLYSAIHKMITSEKTREHYREKGYKRVLDFSPQEIAKQIINFCDEILIK